jgi:hypothetical protein
VDRLEALVHYLVLLVDRFLILLELDHINHGPLGRLLHQEA